MPGPLPGVCVVELTSVVLDVKQVAGRDALLDLVRTADVFVHNNRPQVMGKLGLDYAALQPGFFAGKVKAKSPMPGMSLDQMLERMAEAGIERAFLVAARTGRLGLPGSYHMPYEVVARACEQFPGRFYGFSGAEAARHTRRHSVARMNDRDGVEARKRPHRRRRAQPEVLARQLRQIKYVNSYGRNKVLFGTDFPVLDFKRTVEEIAALGFKPEVRRMLLRENALRVFGLQD